MFFSTLERNSGFEVVSVMDLSEKQLEDGAYKDVWPSFKTMKGANAQVLNIPVLINTNHFVLLVFDLKLMQWTYLDPYHRPMTKPILNFMKNYMDETQIYKESKPGFAKQNDSWSCGLHICIVTFFFKTI